MSQQESAQVEVRFTTRLPDTFLIPNDLYVLDAALDRRGLSQLINDLIAHEVKVPFDFLIDGKFLRSSLAHHYEENSVSSEQTIILEYVKALTAPDSSDLSTEDDWISAISVCGTDHLTGTVSGCIALYQNGQRSHQSTESAAPITSLFLTPTAMISGSKDGTLRVHSTKGELLGSYETDNCVSIQSVTSSPDSTLIISGDFNGRLNMFNSLTKKTRSSFQPRSSFQDCHNQAVTELKWKERLMSSSLDGEVALWDPIACCKIQSVSVGRPATAFDCSGNVAVTGHDDGRIVFWDLQTGPRSLDLEIVSAYKSHVRMISSVSINPLKNHMVATVSHDGALKVFDSRSPKFAVQSSLVGDDKVLACAWADSKTVLTGGSDGKVRSHQFNL